MPWVRFPITDELLLTFTNWISWCYLYCREIEFDDVWRQGTEFFKENPEVHMPLPRVLAIQAGEGIP